MKELWTKYKSEIVSGKYGSLESPYAAFAYDAVWTAALALNASIAELKAQNSSKKIEDFNYNDISMRKTFMSTIKKGSFMGMSVCTGSENYWYYPVLLYISNIYIYIYIYTI